MGVHEVTQGQWIAVMETALWLGEDFMQLGPDHPAVYISWQDTQDFIRALNRAAGDSLPFAYRSRMGICGKSRWKPEMVFWR